MRISDWSSDVCSSDLDNSHHRFCPPISTSSGKLLKLSRRLIFSARTRSVSENRPDSHELPASSWSSGFPSTSVTSMLRARAKRAETCVTRRPTSVCQDRKSVVLGKCVSVRVYRGGRRIINKKQTELSIRYLNVNNK